MMRHKARQFYKALTVAIALNCAVGDVGNFVLRDGIVQPGVIRQNILEAFQVAISHITSSF